MRICPFFSRRAAFAIAAGGYNRMVSDLCIPETNGRNTTVKTGRPRPTPTTRSFRLDALRCSPAFAAPLKPVPSRCSPPHGSKDIILLSRKALSKFFADLLYLLSEECLTAPPPSGCPPQAPSAPARPVTPSARRRPDRSSRYRYAPRRFGAPRPAPGSAHRSRGPP